LWKPSLELKQYDSRATYRSRTEIFSVSGGRWLVGSSVNFSHELVRRQRVQLTNSVLLRYLADSSEFFDYVILPGVSVNIDILVNPSKGL